MRQQGNILFLILIAVALFAALSYAITGSSRNGSDSITKDKAKIAAAEIVQYATQIEQAVTRLKVINGCDDTQISFERAPFDGSDTNYINLNAPSDFRCHVFHPNGGGVSYRVSTFNYLEFNFNGHFTLDGQGTNEKDLILVLLINEEICDAINSSLSIGNNIMNSTAPGRSPLQRIYFSGNYSPVAFSGKIGAAAEGDSSLHGKMNGCIDSTTAAAAFPGVHNSTLYPWYYYHVLVLR